MQVEEAEKKDQIGGLRKFRKIGRSVKMVASLTQSLNMTNSEGTDNPTTIARLSAAENFWELTRSFLKTPSEKGLLAQKFFNNLSTNNRRYYLELGFDFWKVKLSSGQPSKSILRCTTSTNASRCSSRRNGYREVSNFVQTFLFELVDPCNHPGNVNLPTRG